MIYNGDSLELLKNRHQHVFIFFLTKNLKDERRKKSTTGKDVMIIATSRWWSKATWLTYIFLCGALLSPSLLQAPNQDFAVN